MMVVRSSIRRNAAAAKLRRLSQAEKRYVTAARSPAGLLTSTGRRESKPHLSNK
jgi:hypothetical protein